MQQIKRGRQGAEGWREVLARFAQSRLTVRAFCNREGFSTASFYRWRSILKGSQQTPRSQKPSMVADPAAGFVDLGALSTSGSRPPSGGFRNVASKYAWIWVAVCCCIWCAADVLSRRTDPGVSVRPARRHALFL